MVPLNAVQKVSASATRRQRANISPTISRNLITTPNYDIQLRHPTTTSNYVTFEILPFLGLLNTVRRHALDVKQLSGSYATVMPSTFHQGFAGRPDEGLASKRSPSKVCFDCLVRLTTLRDLRYYEIPVLFAIVGDGCYFVLRPRSALLKTQALSHVNILLLRLITLAFIATHLGPFDVILGG
jgi:hypothetical protein